VLDLHGGTLWRCAAMGPRQFAERKKSCRTLLWISSATGPTPKLARRSRPIRPGVPVTQRPKAHPIMPDPDAIAGTAALAICESLLLALKDHNVLPEREIVGILRDAAAAHDHVPADEAAPHHAAVAALIKGIVDGGSAVRRR
jgi:hypothetical protein